MDSQFVSKMVNSEGVPRSKGHSLMRSHNSEMANATNLKLGSGRDVKDFINKEQHVKEESLATNGSGNVTSKYWQLCPFRIVWIVYWMVP